jgi:hypothetical protein
MRLVQRIATRGGDAESFAGLVQAFRFTGLLGESVAAHQLAVALDPTLVTSVAHTHFLRCDYPATLETYGQTRYYLDAAAVAALGDARRATAMLRDRLDSQALSPLMAGLMGSLLAVLEGRRQQAADLMASLHIAREPEAVFYLARHHAMIGDTVSTVQMLQRARREGLASSFTLEHDAAFTAIRGAAAFRRELRESAVLERLTRNELARAGLARAMATPLTRLSGPAR